MGEGPVSETMKSMKKSILALASVLSALLLPGCFQSETTVHLQKDGGGTLVEETKFGAQMLAMMEQMAGIGGGDKPKADPLNGLFTEEKAKKRAAELGEGVTFVKTEPVDVGGAKGARVTYQFKDINQLKLSTESSMKNVSPMGDMEAATGNAPKADPMKFSYADGKLSIRMPEPKKAEAANAPEAPAGEGVDKPDMKSPETQAMVKQMFGDMKVSIKLVIEPGIATTDASHVDGNTITLMDMETGKLFENPETFEKLGKVDQKDPAAAMEALKGLQGVKIETRKEVTVDLK